MAHVSGWPWGYIEEVADHLPATFAPPEYTIVKRPVRGMDPNNSIGLFPVDRVRPPQDVNIGQSEPVLKRYNYRFQLFNKVADEVEGRAINALNVKMLEAVLYRDDALAASLPTLTEELFGTREAFTRFGLSGTKYLNNDLSGAFVFLAQIDLWVETGIVYL